MKYVSLLVALLLVSCTSFEEERNAFKQRMAIAAESIQLAKEETGKVIAHYSVDLELISSCDRLDFVRQSINYCTEKGYDTEESELDFGNYDRDIHAWIGPDITMYCLKKTEDMSGFYSQATNTSVLQRYKSECAIEKYNDEIIKLKLAEYRKDCLELGFTDKTDAIAECILRQQELNPIIGLKKTNSSSMTVADEKEAKKELRKLLGINRSAGGSSFCQKMPGAYTTTYHCW